MNLVLRTYHFPLVSTFMDRYLGMKGTAILDP